MKTALSTKGTHCQSCKALIEEVCKENPCVQSCEVDFATGRTVIEHKDCLDWQVLKKEIESVGAYRVELP